MTKDSVGHPRQKAGWPLRAKQVRAHH